jgi:inward rectifier potassium channel
MASRKQDFTRELTTGFGERSAASGGRYYRKDGKANVIRSGIGILDQLSWYHTMLSMSRWKFWLWLLIPYISVNLLFALVYYAIGIQHLNGIEPGSASHNFTEAFFFSFQTFTTVGYGHVSPGSLLTSSVAAFESFLGVLTLALAGSVFYGRFSKPRSFLKFSDIAVIAPYKDGIALMFRTVPYKNNHLLDAEVKLTLGMRVARNGESKNEFYPLAVEFSKITALILNWTVVHPINENSPLYGMTLDELEKTNAEVLVYLKAYDEGFSNIVVSRTSYTVDEIIQGAKFVPMYNPSPKGHHTVLHVDKLNEIERVSLPDLKAVLS